MRFFVPRFLGLIVFVLFLIVAGTVGYMLIESWSLPDAAYMTVITLTAVGYEEVHPLGQAGQNFTMLLIAGGITAIGIWFALLTALIVELDLTDVLRQRRHYKEIGKLKDHVIICGSGRTGRQVIEELVVSGQPFVVIERDKAVLDSLYEVLPDVQAVHGDATADHNLEAAGIDRARALVSALSADADNLFVCLSARHLNPEMLIVARAFDEQAMSKIFRAGADHVVSPNVSSAIRMASFILRPTVMSLLDVATRSADVDLRLEQAMIPAASPLAGQTLLDAAIPQRTGLIVIALEKEIDGQRQILFNPVATTRLEPGDEMVVLGEPDQVESLREYVGH